MAENSNIEWCDHTFNPWRGCTKVSAGCAHCYAETLSKRNPALLGVWGAGKPRVLASEQMWKEPVKWNAAIEQDPFRECKGCGWRGCAPFEWNRCLACDSDLAGSAIARPRVFCASLADWLDEEVPKEWLYRLLDLIQWTPNLDWLLLTKRPQNFRARLRESMNQCSDRADDFIDAWLEGNPPANVWLGTSVEDQAAADERIPALLAIPARVRFLSCEPLLGEVDLDYWLRGWCKFCQRGEDFSFFHDWQRWLDPETKLVGHGPTGLSECGFCGNEFEDKDWRENYTTDVHWVIAGGESGPGARPMHPDWARSLRDQCAAADVPFLFKQWGGVNKKATGRILDGRTWDAFPA